MLSRFAIKNIFSTDGLIISIRSERRINVDSLIREEAEGDIIQREGAFPGFTVFFILVIVSIEAGVQGHPTFLQVQS